MSPKNNSVISNASVLNFARSPTVLSKYGSRVSSATTWASHGVHEKPIGTTRKATCFRSSSGNVVSSRIERSDQSVQPGDRDYFFRHSEPLADNKGNWLQICCKFTPSVKSPSPRVNREMITYLALPSLLQQLRHVQPILPAKRSRKRNTALLRRSFPVCLSVAERVNSDTHEDGSLGPRWNPSCTDSNQ